MIEWIKNFYSKHKDLVPYAFFGVCTTLVNMFVYWLCAHPLGLPVTASTVIAWVMSVLFAYLTNRKWVFHSQASTRGEIAREILYFYSCRLATGLLDLAIMYIFVDVLHFNDMVIKIASNVLVILLNYVASKLLIFRRKEK